MTLAIPQVVTRTWHPTAGGVWKQTVVNVCPALTSQWLLGKELTSAVWQVLREGTDAAPVSGSFAR